MANKRIYDPEIEAAARDIPMLEMADAERARQTVRDFLDRLAASGVMRPAHPSVEEIEQSIAGPGGCRLNIRIYRHKDSGPGAPAFVNFHGGGFVLGDLDSEHARCLAMTRDTGAVSVAVDYRLAPEHRFPTAAEDCYAALCRISENAAELGIDRDRIVIGGGSAGGNLTAVVALMARDRGGPPIRLQMLFYPAIDHRCSTASMRDGDDCHIWNRQNCADMWDQYLGKDRGAVSPYASPSVCEDLSNLPPVFITACEHDPLRDEAIEYAMRLMQAGVPVDLVCYAGTVHAFDILIEAKLSERAMAEQIAAFKRAVA